MSSIDQQKKLVKRICQKYQNSPWLPLSQLQKTTSLDTPARGGVWISRTSFSAPTNPAIRDVLYTVMHRLKKEYHRISPAEETPVIDVGVEFIGPRSQVPDDAPEPDLLEEEKLRALLQECHSGMIILYAYGAPLVCRSTLPQRKQTHLLIASHSFSSPAQYRASSVRLAKLTGARVASIKYRLAPSHTFPAPILDILIAYASLLYHPPGAFYPAVPANQIILAGISAGANLTLGLMKFLLELQKLSPSDATFDFHGQSVTLPLPAGLAIPACMPGHPTDSLWPASPPREVPYCVAVTVDHELFACGCEERGVDGNRVVASQAAKSGVTVIWNDQVGIAPLPLEDVKKRMKEYNATRSVWTGRLHEHKL
ncbi:hypothetical protein RU639_004699 [Aspergillus parasiticus]